MKVLPGLLLFWLLVAGCEDKKEEQDSEERDEKVEKEKPAEPRPSDKNIVPGTRVGDIHPASSEEDMRSIYGATNVSTKNIDEGEGNMVNATLIYAGTADEVEIFWKDPAGRKNPVRIRIRNAGSGWHINNKIKIGTTLAALEQLNKKPFYITGCCYDAPFAIIDWNNGELADLSAKAVGIRLKPGNATKELNEKIVGDKRYLVTDSTIRNADMKVSEFFIRFN